MKKASYIIVLLLLLSCEGKNESPYCHKGVYIFNGANLPISIYQMEGYQSYNTSYAFHVCSDKRIVNPQDTSFLELVGWQNCLEDIMHWCQSHPGNYDPNLRTIYICDTNKPNSRFYSTPDSVIMQYNILHMINLADSSLSKLKRNNFIIKYQ